MRTTVRKPEGEARPRCEFCGSALYNVLIDKEREGPDAKEHWELGCPYCAQALDDFYMKIRNEILTIDKQKLPEFEKKLDVAKEYASKLGESIMVLRFEAFRAEAWLKNDQGQKALSLFQSLLAVAQEGLKKYSTDSYLKKMENRLYYYLAYTNLVLNDKEQALKFIDLNLKREEELYFQKNSIEWGEFYKALALTLKAEIALKAGVLTDAAKFAEEALQLKLKNMKKTPEFSFSKAVGVLEKIYTNANQPAKITEMQKMLGSVKNFPAAARQGKAEIFDVMK